MALIVRHWSFVSLAILLIAIVSVIWLFGGNLINRTATEALILLVIVVGLYVFIGNSGVLSFGSIGFMAIGAYAAAWFTVPLNMKKLTMPGLPGILHRFDMPVLPASLLAGLLGALVALGVGLIILRLSGIAASIATLSVLVVINVGYSNWEPVTLGTSAIVGLPPYVTTWVALAWALVAMAVAYAYQHSRFGLALRASRDDEVAARAVGIDITRQRLVAWVISAFFVAIGGVLYAHFVGVIYIANFWLGLTFITLAMLVVGGMNSLSGAVLGVVVISVFTELLRQAEKGVEIGGTEIAVPPGIQEMGLAGIMILILIFRPRGLTGNREITWPFASIGSPLGRTGAAGSVPTDAGRT